VTARARPGPAVPDAARTQHGPRDRLVRCRPAPAVGRPPTTPGTQRITLRDGPGSITLEDANGNRITLDTQGVNVSANMSKFSGVVQADTIITNSVVSASYTPGAGNIW
jgi:hypothetical protein